MLPSLKRCLRLVLLILVAGAIASGTASAQAKAKAAKKGKTEAPASNVADYSSKFFIIHTDLPADEAQDLLKKMETMIGLIGRYWGRPPSGVVECWVVQDESQWPEGSIPLEGIEWIRAGAGVTVTDTLTQGRAFLAKSRVYAVADRGTALHEAVHAYCGHAFGRTGPTWYSEGMAEMGQYWREGDFSVNAHPGVIRYLRETEPKDLVEIVDYRETTGDSWQNYAWRWALCHLLANNPNYSPRFRPLGLGLLTGENISFESVYGDMAREIYFEYLFFLKHLETGLRINLCAWDWKAKFKPNKTTSATVSVIEAGRGWQPSKLTVEQDVEYEFVTSGTWTLAKDAKPLTADGDGTAGKLMGIVMTDYTLGEPFELGAKGTFTAPAAGNLYFRCQDEWVSLADNKGKVTVRAKMKGKGKSLIPEEKKPADPKAE